MTDLKELIAFLRERYADQISDAWAREMRDKVNPTEVIADAEAKLRVVELVEVAASIHAEEFSYPAHVITGERVALGRTVLRHLATPFTDHPDYRSKWRL